MRESWEFNGPRGLHKSVRHMGTGCYKGAAGLSLQWVRNNPSPANSDA